MKLSRWYQVRVRPVSLGARRNSLGGVCKNHDTLRVGPQPNRLYGGRRNIQGAKDYIIELKLSLLDFGGSLQGSQGCGRQFSKPSELYVGLILKLSRFKRTL
jgi:hypothetical protein